MEKLFNALIKKREELCFALVEADKEEAKELEEELTCIESEIENFKFETTYDCFGQ